MQEKSGDLTLRDRFLESSKSSTKYLYFQVAREYNDLIMVTSLLPLWIWEKERLKTLQNNQQVATPNSPPSVGEEVIWGILQSGYRKDPEIQ